MLLRWTVTDSMGASPGTDVVVQARHGVPFSRVWPHVARAAGVDPGAAASTGDGDLTAQDVVGRGALLDGADITVRPPHWPAAPRPANGHVALVAVSGPDCGRVHVLRSGGTTVGRHGSCDAVIADPDVSRVHCRLDLTTAGAVVRDRGSTNGTLVVLPRRDGEPPAPAQPAPVDGAGPGLTAPLGSVLVVGSTRLEVRAVAAPSPASRAGERGDGTVVHAPSPRTSVRAATQVVTIPPPPRPVTPRRIPWVMALLPPAVAVTVAIVWSSPVFLLFGLMGPVMLLGNVFSDRRDGRRRSRDEARRHSDTVARLEHAAACAAADAADAARHEHPDLSLVLEWAACRGPRLWERSAADSDAHVVRVGTADLPGPVRIDRSDEGGGVTREQPITLSAVPLTADVSGGVAVVGPGGWAGGVARGMVGRLLTALGPGDLSVAVVAGDPSQAAGQRWGWLRLVPHWAPTASAGGGVGAQVTAALMDIVPDGHRRLVIVDQVAAEGAAALSALAAHPQVLLVVVTQDPAGVPAGVSTWLAPDGEAGTGVARRTTDGTVTGTADAVGHWWALRLARCLAPLRPAVEARRALPPSVLFGEVVHSPGAPGAVPDARDIAELWARSAQDDGLSLPLGVGTGGTVHVDLVRDGPHALIAGTTGAGKSELLRMLVIGLATRYPPAAVAMLLVDFKGGATFSEAARLPHTLGVLTDLDPRAARRVLSSLRAEVRRREAVLAVAGAGDLATWRRTAGAGAEPLPRLLVVVDEFRVLADEAPEVLDGLVRVAAVGRSLGIHLVLATQRPSGAVSADIRANTGLRIALRVADDADSRDVVGVPDAASLPRAFPGRAIVERSGDRVTVQTARVALSVVDDDVIVRPAGDLVAAASATGDGGLAADLVAECLTAAEAVGAAHARAPWAPPLPDAVDVTQVGADTRPAVPGPSLPLCLADLPDEQRQAGVHWRPADDGTLLVLGGPRSGRTSTLQSLAASCRSSGMAVAVLTGTPSAGGWPPGCAVLDWRDTDATSDALVAIGRRATVPGDGWAALLVDDADTFFQRCLERPALADTVAAAMRDGAAARVAIALAGGRQAATARNAPAGRLRVLLRPADEADAAAVGVAWRDVPRHMPPGRCLVMGTGIGDGPVESHIARHSGGPGTPAGSDLHDRSTGARLPGPLPATVTAVRPLPWPHLALGAGAFGDVAVDASAHPFLVIAGPAGSGRTTALRAVARSALAAGSIVILSGPTVARARESGATLPLRIAVGAEQLRQVTSEALADGRRLTVLVDDLDRCPDGLDDAVCELAALAGDGHQLLVVAAATSVALASSFRGVGALARRTGAGLLLHPGRHDGRDVLAAPDAPHQESRLPGRGLLVVPGRTCRVQVAMPTDPSLAGPGTSVPVAVPVTTEAV